MLTLLVVPRNPLVYTLREVSSIQTHRVEAVQILLQHVTKLGAFSLNSLKRSSNHAAMVKLDGLLVTDMFDPALFRAGSYALHPSTYTLRPERMRYYHCLSCPRCRPLQAVAADCYFVSCSSASPMAGTHPVTTSASPRSTARLAITQRCLKELQDMVDQQVLVPTTRPKIINPLGVVLKNADKMRSWVSLWWTRPRLPALPRSWWRRVVRKLNAGLSRI